MHISVVIPTYRRPDLLSRCLLALANQSFPLDQFEIIVVSDGPDHETYSIIQHLRDFHPDLALSFYETPIRKGPAAARNLGWKHAKGDLVVFTDDDCIPSTEWLREYQKSYLFYHRELISFSGQVVVPISEEPTDYEKNIAQLETADFITANCACTKKTLELIQGFDEEFKIACREDSALEFALLELDIPIFKLEKAVVTHPVRQADWGISMKEQRKSMFNALLFKKYPELYKSKISRAPVWDYYLMIALSLAALVSFAAKIPLVGFGAIVIWLFLLIHFIYKRLKNASLSIYHITEMVITSVIIPYLSVYWTIRGAIRYKVFFL